MRMWRHQWPGVPGPEVLSDEGEVAVVDVPFFFFFSGVGGRASRPFTVEHWTLGPCRVRKALYSLGTVKALVSSVMLC